MAFDSPCATWKCAPIGRLIPCTSATLELENAIPAWVDASIIASRGPAVLAVRVGACRRLADGARSRQSASPSVNGFAFLLTYASMAWVSASTPVSAVSRGGIDTVSSKSIDRGDRQERQSRAQHLLVGVAVGDHVNCVASEPLPAVVGTAMIGSAGPVYSAGPCTTRIRPRRSRQHGQRLGGVHRAAAAEPDHPVRLVLGDDPSPASREVGGGVGHGVGEQCRLLTRGPEEAHDRSAAPVPVR